MFWRADLHPAPPSPTRRTRRTCSLNRQFELIHQLQPVAVPLLPPMASPVASRKQNRQLTEMTTPTHGGCIALRPPATALIGPCNHTVTDETNFFFFFLQIYAYTISQVVFLLCFCPNRPTRTLTPGYNFMSHSRGGCWLPTTGESQ